MRVALHGSYPELQVDGRPFFIDSAEFFYPRIPRSLWERSLERYRELGINTITLSIPWNWHEPREGELDFDGHTLPGRDLRGLLKLIANAGFRLIARPGPMVASEWRNGGYPDWLLERADYRMPMVDRLEGRGPAAAQLADADAAARMWLENAVHRKYSEGWLESVARELLPYRAATTVSVKAEEPAGARENGGEREASGPLLLVQVGMGVDSEHVKPTGAAFWKYVEALCSIVVRTGLDAPCVVDAAQPRAATAGSTLAPQVAAMGHWFFGPGISGAGENRRLSPLDFAELEITETSLATQPGFPPVLAEFNPGWYAPEDDARPEFTPAENIRMSTHLLLGYGLRGLNWFPLQDSLTPGGYGTPDANRYFRWDAALALNGSKQAAAREVQRIGDWLRTWGSQLAASHPRADFGLVDPVAALPAKGLARVDVTSITDSLMQIERLAQYAAMSPEIVDPQNQPAEQLLRHALLLFPVYKPEDPSFALTAQAQHTLDAYVRSGGVLACFPGRPTGAVFEEMETGPPAGSGDLPAGTKVWRVGTGRLVVLTKDFYSWVSPRQAYEEGTKQFEASSAGPMLVALLKSAGVRRAIRRAAPEAEAPELVASELVTNEGTLPLGDRSGGQAWLSVVNLSYEKAASETLEVLSPRASARLEKSAASDWIQVPVRLPPRESLLLPIEVELCLEPTGDMKCEDRVISSGAELVRAEREKKAMLLTFYGPTKASARIHLGARPEHIELDDTPAEAHWTKGSNELVVEMLRGASPQFQHELRLPLSYQPALPERPKADGRHPGPAHFRFSPAGGVRLPLGEDESLLSNPPLFVFRQGEEGSLWVLAEDLGGQGESVQVETTGQFNASTRAYVSGKELRSINLRLPGTAVEKAATEAPAADGLYHGVLHFAAGGEKQELPVSYAILREKGAVGYQFDFDDSGSADWVLENSGVRAIVSPADGGRIIGLLEKPLERNLASTMGLLEDVFAFTPNPEGVPRERARGRAGTFNRSYAAEWIREADGPALRLRYDAPDAYPHGARIEKTVRLTGERTIAADYRVSLLPADARRLEDEAAGRIFAAPAPSEPVPQSFEILNSIPATAGGASSTEFCWKKPGAEAKGGAGAEHCERFEPGGAAISPPAGVRQTEVREGRRAGLAIECEDEGARLTLEPKQYSVLVRLAFPPLDAGGAASTYRIEFSVKEAP